jgi:eukaryotic-like serine/threonine-protein kinase
MGASAGTAAPRTGNPQVTDSLLTRRPENAATADDAELARVLEAYLADVEAGRAPSAAELVEAHTLLAERLGACLASLAFVEQAGGEMGAAALVDGIAGPLADERATLGDFRLVREIGRGGMGIVYEAEQLSLARRVAVKVLPFAAMLDQRQLARFKNEARAAAGLHHPHIVPVYYVGAERGVHFYAMQYIEGKSLGGVRCPWSVVRW